MQVIVTKIRGSRGGRQYKATYGNFSATSLSKWGAVSKLGITMKDSTGKGLPKGVTISYPVGK